MKDAEEAEKQRLKKEAEEEKLRLKKEKEAQKEFDKSLSLSNS